jgi:aspartate aminotransferase
MENLLLHQRVLHLSPSATLQMQGKAKILKDQGVSVVALSAGESDFETPMVIVDAAKKALDKGVSRYTAVRGSDELIKAMQLKFLRDQKVSYSSLQVLSTVGAKSAIAMALESVAGPGDEVIVLSPFWVSYPEQVRLTGANPVFVSASAEQNYIPTADMIKAAVTTKTKAIILNSPNNPTGAVFSEQVLREIMEIFVGTAVWVISDEIYEHLVFDSEKHISPASFSPDAYARTVVISGASKGYAMTGWRVGVVGGPLPIIDAMAKLQQQRYSCIASISQAAAAFALQETPELKNEIEKMRITYQMRRDEVMHMIKNLPEITCVKPKGAFYAFLNFSKWMGKIHRGILIENDDCLALRLLSEAHVAVVSGAAFGAPGCLRLSIASSLPDILEGMKRIQTWLES